MGPEDWDRKWEDREPRIDPSRFLVQQAEDRRPGRALDVACGAGRHAVWLAERGWQVTALDFSKVALQRARALAVERGVEIDWVRADARDYEPEPGAYDLVVVLYLQLPQVEQLRVLGHASAAVASGGTILVVGHDRSNLTDGYGGPKTLEVLSSHDDISRGLGDLTVVRAERVRRPVSDETGEHEAIDALVCAERPDCGA